LPFECNLQRYNPVYNEAFEFIISPSDLITPGGAVQFETLNPKP
jgi:hypothetical protein